MLPKFDMTGTRRRDQTIPAVFMACERASKSSRHAVACVSKHCCALACRDAASEMADWGVSMAESLRGFEMPVTCLASGLHLRLQLFDLFAESLHVVLCHDLCADF